MEEYYFSKTKFIVLVYMKSRDDRLFRVGLEVQEVARDQVPFNLVVCYP